MKNVSKIISCMLLAFLCITILMPHTAEAATVQQGSTGTETKYVQYNLNFLGYSVGTADGICGSKTVKAIKSYQADHNLTVDGIAGNATQKSLTSEVKSIQKLLKNKGYYTDSLDGIAGPNTVSALKKFQKANKLTQSGVANSSTLKLLKKSNNSTTDIKETTTNSSTLQIGSGKYAPETLNAGSSYSISGKITSNYKITSVTVGVYNKDGSATSQVKTVKPNTTSYNIKNVDSYIKFGKLSDGSYIFKVTAKDASGASKTLVNKSFTVKDKAANLNDWKETVLSTWTEPVTAKILKVNSGREFGAYRTKTRSHAGMDYYVSNGDGTPVYAMQAGKVIEYCADFYYGTSSVAIKHDDGSIARYCEIKVSKNLKKNGATVKQGEQIGTIKANDRDEGTMLHLELYYGTATGSLSSSNTTYDYVTGKYNRRQDLIDPTFLLDL